MRYKYEAINQNAYDLSTTSDVLGRKNYMQHVGNEHNCFLKLLWYSEVMLLHAPCMGRWFFEGYSGRSNVKNVSFETLYFFCDIRLSLHGGYSAFSVVSASE